MRERERKRPNATFKSKASAEPVMALAVRQK